MSSRKRKAADRAARDAVTSQENTPAAAEESGQLRTAYLDRRRRQSEHDAEQRQLRAARKAEGPSATERALMTATADTYAGTRTDWHLDFVRLHSARRVDLRGTPEIDPRLVNRLSAAERAAARQKHALAVAALEKHAPAQAAAYHAAFPAAEQPAEVRRFIDAAQAPWERAMRLEVHLVAILDAREAVVRHRLWAAVRHMLSACDGIVPEAVADYTAARQEAIYEAERKERKKHAAALRAGTVDAASVRRWRDS
jgi:hypothetical protein